MTARILVGCVLAAASGALLALGFAPYDHGWLVWWAFVPMLVAQHRVLPAAWSALAPALGIGGFMLAYFGGAFFPEGSPWYLKGLPLLVAALVFVLSRRERARQELDGYAMWPLAAAASWVTMELARSFVPSLGTWGFLGYALYRQPWLLQPVRIFGIYGLDLLIVAVNYAIALAVIAGLDRRGTSGARAGVDPRHAVRWCARVLAAFVAWCIIGWLSSDRSDATVRVAVLQPGARGRDLARDREARDRAMLDRLGAQTRDAASRGARLVVWPEGGLGTDPAIAHATELAGLARSTGATLVVGYAFATAEGKRNEVVTVNPQGEFVGRYGKDHPVAFLGETSISRGTYPTIDTAFGRMGSIICYDTDFTDTARKLARQGAKIIAVPSADWPAIAAKHYVHSVFRALETGAAVAKSEYSVDSAIIDAWGRIDASAITPDGSAAVLVADVPLREGTPPVAWLGDWVGWLCAAGVLSRMLFRWRSRRARLAPKFQTPDARI